MVRVHDLCFAVAVMIACCSAVGRSEDLPAPSNPAAADEAAAARKVIAEA